MDLYQNYNNRQETGCTMKPLSSFIKLAIVALAIGSAPLHAISDEEGRPRLDQFSSYDAFMKAMVAWESRPARPHAIKAQTAAATPRLPSTRPIPVPEGIDPTSESAPPPLAITGPEDLDTAVELAKDISHPDYTAPVRYNRSTHISFPLPSIDGSDMSQASIPNGLQVKKPVLVDDKSQDAIDQQMTLETLTKMNESSKGVAPETFAGMSIGPRNGPSHIVIDTTN
ncbi:MAG TPA: hypothetical protein DF427_00330 [Moraxellaceae bacterium]|nr:hypothetical protein [Moraxellaceae bacterium]